MHLLNLQFKLSQPPSYKLGQQHACVSWGGKTKTDTPETLQHTNTTAKGSMSSLILPRMKLQLTGFILALLGGRNYILINLVQGGSSKPEPEQQNDTFWPLSRR